MVTVGVVTAWKIIPHSTGCVVSHRIQKICIFSYVYHKNQPNVGRYTIHGSYGFVNGGYNPFLSSLLKGLTMVIKHLLNGMILQVVSGRDMYWWPQVEACREKFRGRCLSIRTIYTSLKLTSCPRKWIVGSWKMTSIVSFWCKLACFEGRTCC